MRRGVALVAVVALAACKDDPNSKVCHHYADLFEQCREDKTDAADLVKETAHNFCLKGMNGKNEDTFGPKYKAMIECVRSATDCAAYRKCQEP